ncbi:hypothetical protein MAPG_07493 [Magnaporthiopsis poae ATCC 64411]|uniref:Uncharacterized protein n=1 Tax=Magnaporthiopsis poae (strain ATCC 64411 / 73-15) TaxID=644358 RepID=A0A0C4E4U2_MAGP6|nr:hypothetical protein MAPG_07493 [Magnaporthiopsis poae ATCC 64411]
MSGRQGCVPLLAPEGGEYEYAGYSYEYTGEYAAEGGSGGQGNSGGSGKDNKPKRSKSKKKKKEVKPPPGKGRSGYN